MKVSKSKGFQVDLEMKNLSEAEDVEFTEVYEEASCTRTCITLSIKPRSLKAVGDWEEGLL